MNILISVCPRSSDLFYKVSYYIKSVTTSWTQYTDILRSLVHFVQQVAIKKMDKNIRYYWILSGIPGQRRQRGWPALQLLDTCQPTRPEVRASIILFQVNSTSQHLWTYYCYGLRLQNWYMRGVLESRCERYNSYSWANDKFNIPLPPPFKFVANFVVAFLTFQFTKTLMSNFI